MLRSVLIGLSESKSLRNFAEQSPLGLRFSQRFVAGMDVEDAIHATQAVNEWGAGVSIDNLGENVTNAEEAKHSAELYHHMLDEIDKRKLNANISLKLTHMGLDVDEELAFRLVTELVDHAVRINNFLRVDMEGSPYTQRTIDFVRGLHRLPGHSNRVGTVIQSYLYRSEKDVNDLLAERIRIRLCKGAYKEPAEIAFPKKADVDANYVKLARTLMKSGVFHGLATHDENIIAELKQFARIENIPRSAYEFQMLYGVRRDLQQQLVREGYGLRVYIPFGSEWYPYFMRRLAERPANVLFIAKNMFRQ
jgi:proline dehydrogenase